MCAAAFALPPLEITVRCASASFAGGQHVVVHANTHAASGIAPFKSCLAENAVEPFLFRIGFDHTRARYNQSGLESGRDVFATNQARHRTQILEARIRARPDENAIDPYIYDGCSRTKGHVFERANCRFLL